MRGLARLRWYRFGDRYLEQVSGMPIGGPVSGAALEAVLSVDEHMFDKFGWGRSSKKLGVHGAQALVA